MVELVDTQDLKSCSRKRSAGSIPALSTRRERRFDNRSFPFLFPPNLLLIKHINIATSLMRAVR